MVPLLDGESVLGALIVARSEGGEDFDESHLNGLSTLAALAGVARHNADLRDSQRNFFVHLTEILMSALDLHVDTQAGHARRVAHVANRIGRKMGFEGATSRGSTSARCSTTSACSRSTSAPRTRRPTGAIRRSATRC